MERSMHRPGFLLGVVVSCLTLSLAPSVARGQTSGFPDISARTYTDGSIEVSVTGSATIEGEIPLNKEASISDGEVTWLQFGVSGAAEPHSLITYTQTREIGISVGKGKWIAIGGITPGQKSECTGQTLVTATEVTGDYACKGVASHDPEGGVQNVDVTVSFTARSQPQPVNDEARPAAPPP
jgi:hypothetical protein